MGADVDQLALEVGGELVEISGARVQVKSQPDQWRLGDADIDGGPADPRGFSLRGSHSAIIAGQ